MHMHPNARSSLDDVQPTNKTPVFQDILRLGQAAEHLQIREATLRHLRFYADDRRSADNHVIPGNGFAPAFLKLGRAVYVDIPVFLNIWRSQQATSQGAHRGK